uniref:Ankyrin repeat protein n=1 Tax=Pithovirus LCPAC101 TaxID=2506586 RepID=A0A481Z4C5_9VIRU|nr:MAG: ankyrin repeat protein [Pithovirus LCPAC101]
MENIIPSELYIYNVFKFLNYTDIISFIMTNSRYSSLDNEWNIIYKNKYYEFYEKIKLRDNINSKNIFRELENSEKKYEVLYNIENNNNEISQALILNNMINLEKEGNWIFIKSCEYGNIYIVKLLISLEIYGLNEDDGNLGFYYACKNGNMELIKLLMNIKKIDINGNIKNPLILSIETKNLELVTLLLLDIRLNPSIHYNLPIMLAKIKKYTYIYKLLKDDPRVIT